MAAILSHACKTSEFEAEVVLESTPYENWYFLSRDSGDGMEYYSAHEDTKHVFFTPVNDDIWNWEMWTIEEYTSDNNTFPLLKSYHDTYILMDHESGFIWQTDDPSSCEGKDLITMNITECPAFEPTESDNDESETDPAIAKMLLLKAHYRTKKKTPPSDSEAEPAPKKKTKKKTPPPSDSDDESEAEPAPKKKTKKKTPPPSDSDDESETEPAPKKKTKKKTDGDKPKRKPNIKLMAFQAYCRDYRPKMKTKYPEAKLGEQQKVLGEWWKDEDEEVHTKYTKLATRKAAETSE